MNKEQIEPCPFCGKPSYQASNGEGKHIIRCIPCGVSMEQDRKDKVIGMWNSRQKSQSVEQSKPGITELIDIRNKLYNDLPTAEVNAWDLLQTIKWHINELDVYMSRVKSVTPAPEMKWVSVEERLPSAGTYCVKVISKATGYQNHGQGFFSNDGFEMANFPGKNAVYANNKDFEVKWLFEPLPAPPLNPQDNE